MTTIVFDGRFLVAESVTVRPIIEMYDRKPKCLDTDKVVDNIYVCTNKIQSIPASKNVVFNGERVIAIVGAGSTSMIQFMKSMIMDNIPLDKYIKNHRTHLTHHRKESADPAATLLVITAQNAWGLRSDSPNIRKITSFPYAIGSGSDHALFAMKLGANIFQAVAMASIADPFSRGPITYITLDVERDEYPVQAIGFDDVITKFKDQRQKFSELITETIGRPRPVDKPKDK